MTRRRVLTILTVLVAVVAAATALAAPNRTGSVPNGGSYKWDGGPISGVFAFAEVGDNFNCGDPGKECDETLIDFAAGQATVSITAAGDPGSVDLDLYIYKSNAAGEAVGPVVKSSTGSDAEELATFPASAGKYLVRVVPATATQGTFKGEAKEPLKYVPPDVDYGIDPADPGAGRGTPGGGAAEPANNLAPTTTAKAPRNSQTLRLSGTARDRDGRVAYVDIALVRALAHSCKGLTPSGTWQTLRKCNAPRFLRAKGTESWHYTLRHRLARGKYVLFARATDNFGRREGGFGPRNKITFRIR